MGLSYDNADLKKEAVGSSTLPTASFLV